MTLIGRTHSVIAFNSAAKSDNLMHNDDYAKAKGFRGGLVPGTDGYGYMTNPAVQAWGGDWLRQGYAEFRLLQPLFQGDPVDNEVIAASDTELQIRQNMEGAETATATFRASHDLDAAALEPIAEMPATDPDARPPASEETLGTGKTLGVIRRRLSSTDAEAVLRELSETAPEYSDLGAIHPAYQMRMCNWCLSLNVKMRPWIHTGSKVYNFDILPVDQDITARAQILRNYDHKGHQFVEADIRFSDAGDRLLSRVLHTAIWSVRPA